MGSAAQQDRQADRQGNKQTGTGGQGSKESEAITRQSYELAHQKPSLIRRHLTSNHQTQHHQILRAPTTTHLSNPHPNRHTPNPNVDTPCPCTP
jgi:hypothetical protein